MQSGSGLRLFAPVFSGAWILYVEEACMKFHSCLFAGIGLLLAACSDGRNSGAAPADAPHETAVEHALQHADPAYVCPMHPQIVRDKPGNCPICGMTLVKKSAAPPSEDPESERKPLYYRNPMNPAVTSDKPMKDEMGMDYIPVYADADADAGTVRIAAGIVQNMGVRTEAARRGTLWKYIKAVGYIGYNEDRLLHVHARATGWIERIYVHAQGERVGRDQPLVDYYSPELVSAQEELLIAARGGSMLSQAKDRLHQYNVPQQVIDEVLRSGKSRKTVPLLSPSGGVISALGVRHGMYITPDMQLFTIADLSEVWVKVSVFDHQLSWVGPGRKAEMRISALPGRVFEGTVDYIYPELDPVTRTLQVRLKFSNAERLLQPNMFADVAIYGGPEKDALSVPREAVIFSGREERVILSLGEGRFRPAVVTVGMRTPERIEILEGLREGDTVVTSAQFLIDSEATLRGTFNRMQPASQGQGAGHAH
jgi:membrane fusion protein, copper/silver efflux system